MVLGWHGIRAKSPSPCLSHVMTIFPYIACSDRLLRRRSVGCTTSPKSYRCISLQCNINCNSYMVSGWLCSASPVWLFKRDFDQIIQSNIFNIVELQSDRINELRISCVENPIFCAVVIVHLTSCLVIHRLFQLSTNIQSWPHTCTMLF